MRCRRGVLRGIPLGSALESGRGCFSAADVIGSGCDIAWTTIQAAWLRRCVLKCKTNVASTLGAALLLHLRFFAIVSHSAVTVRHQLYHLRVISRRASSLSSLLRVTTSRSHQKQGHCALRRHSAKGGRSQSRHQGRGRHSYAPRFSVPRALSRTSLVTLHGRPCFLRVSVRNCTPQEAPFGSRN
jgi:hypothetical protein